MRFAGSLAVLIVTGALALVAIECTAMSYVLHVDDRLIAELDGMRIYAENGVVSLSGGHIMQTSRQRAHDIIELWTEQADIREMIEHRKAFWIIRDILNGLHIPPSMAEDAILFVQAKCKDSDDKALLLQEVEKCLE
jgi:hypothetical protein